MWRLMWNTSPVMALLKRGKSGSLFPHGQATTHPLSCGCFVRKSRISLGHRGGYFTTPQGCKLNALKIGAPHFAEYPPPRWGHKMLRHMKEWPHKMLGHLKAGGRETRPRRISLRGLQGEPVLFTPFGPFKRLLNFVCWPFLARAFWA